MNIEEKTIKFMINSKRSIFGQLNLYEEAPDNEDMVLVETNIMDKNIKLKSENFFSALLELRRELEKENIQIVCNGSAKNVYPSRMQLSMGTGRRAYKLSMGQQAKNSDMVDIFDCDEELEFVGIDEQAKYYSEWIKSVMGKWRTAQTF